MNRIAICLILISPWACAGGAAGRGGAPLPAGPSVVPRAADEARFDDPIQSIKPVLTDEQIAAAEPLLEAYLQRVLAAPPGASTAGAAAPARKVTLIQAKPFAEGHVHETWFLTLDVDGAVDHAALKVFADPAAADANAERFRMARDYGWPVPTEIVRGSTAPYSDRPSLLMEFMVGGSLRTHVEALYADAGAPPAPEDVADLYGEVGDILGYLHRDRTRARTQGDPTARPAMEWAIARCAREGWCDAAAQARLAALAGLLDQGAVTFCHGDLYESQVIMNEDGRVRAFIDLDDAGPCDPASDVGQLLGHVLFVNPVARAVAWKAPAPTEEETTLTARQLLLAYRTAAELSDADYAAFLERVKAFAWLRMAKLLARYRDNVHARPMIEALTARRQELTAADPFARLGAP